MNLCDNLRILAVKIDSIRNSRGSWIKLADYQNNKTSRKKN